MYNLRRATFLLGSIAANLDQSSFYPECKAVSQHQIVQDSEYYMQPDDFNEKLELPPTSGKYFYTDFRQPNSITDYGEHVFDILVGDTDENLDIWFSLQEEVLALFTTECPKWNCNIPTRYNPFDSSTYIDIGVDLEGDTEYLDKQYDAIQKTSFKGSLYQDEVKFHYGDRQVDFKPTFWAITESSKNISSSFDGYIGLKPWGDEDDPDILQYNVLWQFMDQGHIEHPTFALYTQMVAGNSSTIKFGSYDKMGVEGGKPLEMLRTVSSDTWGVGLYSATVNDVTLEFDQDVSTSYQDRIVFVDPQVPWLYIPAPDYEVVKAKVKEIYGSAATCDSRRCFFFQTCDKIETDKFNIKIRLFDYTGNTVDLELKNESIFVPGAVIGRDTRCYMSLFSKDISDTDLTWLLGNIVLADYYSVFDASPAVEREKDYVQMGIALQNPETLIPEFNRPDSGEDTDNEEQANVDPMDPDAHNGEETAAAGDIGIIIVIVAVTSGIIIGVVVYQKKATAEKKAQIFAQGGKRPEQDSERQKLNTTVSSDNA